MLFQPRGYRSFVITILGQHPLDSLDGAVQFFVGKQLAKLQAAGVHELVGRWWRINVSFDAAGADKVILRTHENQRDLSIRRWLCFYLQVGETPGFVERLNTFLHIDFLKRLILALCQEVFDAVDVFESAATKLNVTNRKPLITVHGRAENGRVRYAGSSRWRDKRLRG